MKKLSLYIFLVLMFNNIGFAMEKKITCSLHEGYSHFASDSLNRSLIGKKIDIDFNVDNKTIKFINNYDYDFTYLLPTMGELIPLTYIHEHTKERTELKKKNLLPEKPVQIDQALFILSFNPQTEEPTNVRNDDLFFESRNVWSYPEIDEKTKETKFKTEAFSYVSKITLGSDKFSVVIQPMEYDRKNLKILPTEVSGFQLVDFICESKF